MEIQAPTLNPFTNETMAHQILNLCQQMLANNDFPDDRIRIFTVEPVEQFAHRIETRHPGLIAAQVARDWLIEGAADCTTVDVTADDRVANY